MVTGVAASTDRGKAWPALVITTGNITHARLQEHGSLRLLQTRCCKRMLWGGTARFRRLHGLTCPGNTKRMPAAAPGGTRSVSALPASAPAHAVAPASHAHPGAPVSRGTLLTHPAWISSSVHSSQRCMHRAGQRQDNLSGYCNALAEMQTDTAWRLLPMGRWLTFDQCIDVCVLVCVLWQIGGRVS